MHWTSILAMHSLSNVYINRIRGDRGENIDLAIDHYIHALKVMTSDTFPEDWGMIQNKLAAAYINRIRGDLAENIDLAIDHYTHALEHSLRTGL